MARFRQIVLIGLCALPLSACGGSTLPISHDTPGAGLSVAHEAVRATIHVAIPRHHRHRRGHYVSPSTKGMTIAFAGPTPTIKTIGLTPSSPGCSSGANGTTCTISFMLKPCPSSAPCYSGFVTTFDNVSCAATCTIPTGSHQLSSNQSVAFSIAAGAPNTIGLTLDGLPASVALVPGGSSTLTGNSNSGFTLSKCATLPQSVSVVGVDADGNQIVGSGAPVSPALSSDDAAHLAVATPAPGASPNAFALVPVASLTANTVPKPGSAIYLTASVTPLADSGGSKVETAITVTFNHDICGIVTEFSTGVTGPVNSIAAGADGNVWFTVANSKVGRITTDGLVTEFSNGIAGGANHNALGPDGNMWFTDCSADKIGTITPAGAVTEYSTGITAAAEPQGITAGPGGLWFTECSADQIGMIPTDGTMISEYSIPTAGAQPFGIAAGPDGNIWFTESQKAKIGRVTPDGQHFSEFGVTAFPLSIVAGPDGNMWFTEGGGNRIGRITPGGTITEFSGLSGPWGITAGPDGNLWFTEFDDSRVGKITTAGAITEYSSGIRNPSNPEGIAVGPDGNLWFAEPGLGAGAVGRVQ